MKQMTIPVKETAKIEIKATEDLSIEGTSDKFLTAIVETGESLKISAREDGLVIKVTADCRLLVPQTAVITIEKVGGDLTINGVTGRVIMGKVGGDLTLQKIGGASIETVDGDIGLKEVPGTFEVARVGGDLDGKSVAVVTSRAVGGDVFLLDVIGSVDLVAGGDVILSASKPDVSEMNIKAGGDIKLVLKPDAHALLELVSKGDEISVHACGQQGDWEQEEISIPLGEGGSTVKLMAGGRIEVTDQDSVEDDFEKEFDWNPRDWEDFAVDLKKTINESMDSIYGSVDEIRQMGREVGEKARQEIREAFNKRKVKFHKRNLVGFSFDEPLPVTKQKTGKVSDEERMLVLRMLQEKKISIEEAEKLLNALDH